MTDDIEHLKQHKIAPTRARTSRVHLPTLGGPAVDPALENVDEAFGGTGELPDEAVSTDVLRERIVDALKSVYDPEIPLNIYDLGLIYGFTIEAGGHVEVQMTLTAPACPVAGMLVTEVARKVGEVEGVAKSHVELVWDPPWTKDRMTEAALLELGLL